MTARHSLFALSALLGASCLTPVAAGQERTADARDIPGLRRTEVRLLHLLGG